MAKRVDQRNDITATGFKDPGHDDTGKWLRVVFVERDGREVPLQMPIDLVDQLLPFLAKHAQAAKRRAGDQSVRNVFAVKSGEVSGSKSDDAVVFTFDITAGARFAFELDRTGAAALLTSLSEHLKLKDPAHKAKPDHGPTRH